MSAIALQDSHPRRNQLRHWYEIISTNVLLASTVRLTENANLNLEGLPRLESDDPTVASEEQLSQASIGSGGELAQEGEHPALEHYQPGDSVWAYFPQSQDKWLRATVVWVRDRMIRVEAGFLGMLIEKAELIAPGDWEIAT